MPNLKAQFDQLGWELEENIGQGGQAQIYRVRRKGEDRHKLFAAKLLKNSESRQAYERFYREIESVKRVHHPSVVSIEDHSRADADLHYYVMPYVEGTVSLKRVIGSEDNPFFGNALKSVAFFESLIEALQACESQKVVHRDLSPGNVLLLPNGRPLLIDFGCCWIEDGAHITLTEENVGTPNYRAPECEAYGATAPTPRADFYSAGKLLWSVLTNRLAFPREDIWEQDRLRMPTIFPNKPETWHLHSLFDRTVRRDVARRFQEALEAIKQAREVRRLIEWRYLPLEAVGAGGYCPMCGHKTLVHGSKISKELGAAPAGFPSDAALFVCGACGYCTVIREVTREQTLDGRNR